MTSHPKNFAPQKSLTCNKKRLPQVLSKEQILDLLDNVDSIETAMVVYIGIFQGLRIGETVSLKWSQVDLEHVEILVLDAKNTKRYKSGYGKDRIVPINEMFLPVWKAYKNQSRNQEQVS